MKAYGTADYPVDTDTAPDFKSVLELENLIRDAEMNLKDTNDEGIP